MEIKTTEAAILVETGKPLVIDTIELPDKLMPGQVLVRVITSGICGAQINEIDAVKGPDKFLPHLLGHEGFAEVIEVGPAVVKVKSGDHVIMHWRPSAGIQSETPKYKFRNKIVNAGWVTTFNKHAVVSENRITKIDADSDRFFAPMYGCALTTALGVLENDAKLTHRDSLLIAGFGGVGVAILQFAKYLNVQSIIVLEKNEVKRVEAMALGADHFVVSSTKGETISVLAEIAKTIGKPSVAIETTGHPQVIEMCYESTRDDGRVVLVGVPRIGNLASIYTLPLHFGKSITGSKGGGSIPDIDIPFISNLVNNRKIDSSKFPVNVSKFADLNQAISDLRGGISGRIVIEM